MTSSKEEQRAEIITPNKLRFFSLDLNPLINGKEKRGKTK